MGRKRKDNNIVVAECEGRILSWCDGMFAGDKEFLTLVREAINNGHPTWLMKPVVAHPATIEGAVSAMLSVENARIVEAPDVIQKALIVRENVLLVNYV